MPRVTMLKSKVNAAYPGKFDITANEEDVLKQTVPEGAGWEGALWRKGAFEIMRKDTGEVLYSKLGEGAHLVRNPPLRPSQPGKRKPALLPPMRHKRMVTPLETEHCSGFEMYVIEWSAIKSLKCGGSRPLPRVFLYYSELFVSLILEMTGIAM